MKKYLMPTTLSELRVKTKITTFLISVCMLVSAFLVANFFGSFNQFMMYYPFILTILIVLMVLNETKYRKEFEEMVSPELINKYFQSKQITPLFMDSSNVNGKMLKQTQLTPHFDDMSSDDSVGFNYKGKVVNISDMRLRHKGKNVESGVFVVIDFKRDLPGVIYAVKKDLSEFYKSDTTGENHVNELTSFSQLAEKMNKNIDIYTNSFDFSKEFYSRKMIDIQNNSNKNELIEIFVSGSRVYAFIANRSFDYSPPISVDKPEIGEVKNKINTTLDFAINTIDEIENKFPKAVFAQ